MTSQLIQNELAVTWVFVQVSIYPSTYYLYAYSCIYVPIYLSIHLPLSTYISGYLPTFPFIYLSIHSLVYLSIYLLVHPSILLSMLAIHLFTDSCIFMAHGGPNSVRIGTQGPWSGLYKYMQIIYHKCMCFDVQVTQAELDRKERY